MLHVTEHQKAVLAFYPSLGYVRIKDEAGDQGRDVCFGKRRGVNAASGRATPHPRHRFRPQENV